MRLVCIVAAASLAACGRVGFDASDGGGSSDSDAVSSAIEPREVAVEIFSTTSTTFTPIDGATIEIPPSPGRRWLVVATATLETTSLDADSVELRYLVDDVERGIGASQHVEAGKGGPWLHFYAFDGGTAPIEIRFELRDALATTATVKQLRAVAIPLPEGASDVYASQDAEEPVTATVSTPVVAFDAALTPGEYLFFALAVGREGTGSDLFVEWIGPDGTVRLRDAHNVRGSWQAQFTMWRENVAATIAQFKLNAYVSSGANPVRDVRVFGIRTSDVPSIDFAAMAGPVDTASANPVVFTQLAPAGAASRYLHLATSRVDDRGCVGGNYADRRSLYTVDGVVVDSTSYVVSNCAHEVTNGTVGILEQRPAKLEVQVASGNGITVRALDGKILLLGLL